MVTEAPPRRLAPLAIGVALFALVVGLAILPNTGAVPAQSSCQYGVCTNSTASNTTWYVVIGVLLLIFLALAILILRGRQRTSTSPQEWEPGPSASAGPNGPSADIPDGATTGALAGAGAGVAAAYVESPEDVAVPAAGAAAAGGAAASGEEPDIDSLMAELDKISGEILTRGNSPKKPGGSGGSDDKSS
jgi:hypothetical protein